MTKAYPNIWWERYADDGVLHCQSYKQAVFIKQELEERFQQFGLELNKEKTRIVYCKDNRRSQNYSEYSCAVTPQVRQTGNRLSGLAGTAYASLLA